MNTLLLVLLLVEVCALAAIAAALWLSLQQHRATQLQLGIVRQELDQKSESTQAQNILYALGLLRDPELRKAVMVVRSRLRGKPMNSWEASDTFHVLLVCSTYNLLGLLVKHDVVPRQLFLEHWGASVLDMYQALEDFINRRRRSHPQYCADFLWLCEQSLQAQRSAPVSDGVPMQPPEAATHAPTQQPADVPVQ